MTYIAEANHVGDVTLRREFNADELEAAKRWMLREQSQSTFAGGCIGSRDDNGKMLPLTDIRLRYRRTAPSAVQDCTGVRWDVRY